MGGVQDLFDNNRRWVAEVIARDPGFFDRLAGQQSPKYLWIGCADSRVPANEIVGLLPGELFVHRNVSNVVRLDDPNCLSVLQYAVDVLHVQHVIVCGHLGCGGVEAALDNRSIGFADQWLKNVRDVRDKHHRQLDALPSRTSRFNRLCELNVIEQVFNVSRTSILHDAWARGQEIEIHGWIYAISNGLLRDLVVNIRSLDEAEAHYKAAVANRA